MQLLTGTFSNPNASHLVPRQRDRAAIYYQHGAISIWTWDLKTQDWVEVTGGGAGGLTLPEILAAFVSEDVTVANLGVTGAISAVSLSTSGDATVSNLSTGAVNASEVNANTGNFSSAVTADSVGVAGNVTATNLTASNEVQGDSVSAATDITAGGAVIGTRLKDDTENINLHTSGSQIGGGGDVTINPTGNVILKSASGANYFGNTISPNIFQAGFCGIGTLSSGSADITPPGYTPVGDEVVICTFLQNATPSVECLVAYVDTGLNTISVRSSNGSDGRQFYFLIIRAQSF